MPTSAMSSSTSNKDSALFYLEALKEDVHRAAQRHYFSGHFVSYRDLSVREAQLQTAISLVQNRIAGVPIDEPSDEDLEAIQREPA